MTKNFILTCAGKSSRFKDVRPKYLLHSYDSQFMAQKSISLLKFDYTWNKFAVFCEKNIDKYKEFHKQLFNILEQDNFKIIILDETSCQAETVLKTIKIGNILQQQELYVKDCDNMFSIESWIPNCLYGVNIKNTIVKNISNKSYYNFSSREIVEKDFIGEFFSSGLYSFKRVEDFIFHYEKIKEKNKETSVAGVFSDFSKHVHELKSCEHKLNNLPEFSLSVVMNYCDWGTLGDWLEYNRKFKTYFVDFDGTLFLSDCQEGDSLTPIGENIKTIKDLISYGNQVIITTARPESHRGMIVSLLNNLDIKPTNVIMDCYHSQRVIINDFAKTNRYPTCIAINIKRNSPNLFEYLNGVLDD